MEMRKVLYNELCRLLAAFDAGDEWDDASLCEAFYDFGLQLKPHLEDTGADSPLTDKG